MQSKAIVKILASVVTLWLWCSVAQAAVFQYTVQYVTKKDPGTAFLWLPSTADHIRGVVFAGSTLMERPFVKDARIRAVCEEQKLAIVFLQGGLSSTDPQLLLNEFAKVSEYKELSNAPLFFVGHSAGGPQAKEAAIKYADRCFGLMQYRGGVPGDPKPEFRVPESVPTLAMVGQFDEFGGFQRDEAGREHAWEQARDGLIAARGAGEGYLASIVVEPGAGHFGWSDRNSTYMSLFLKKAAIARIPDWSSDATEPVKCNRIDPATGWLTDLTAPTFDKASPHAWKDYAADHGKAQWHFDAEMAAANVEYHKGFGRKDQFIKWSDPTSVDAGVRHFFQKPTWVDDGTILEVHPVATDLYPTTQPSGGPRWADAGKPAGHADTPIKVRVVSGPLEVVGDLKFRLHYDALSPAMNGPRTTFLAYREGDDTYRYTEQVGMLPKNFKGFAGNPQTISFPPIGDLNFNAAPVELKATSDSGLPVEYYVAFGPAEMRDSKLVLKELPLRAAYPIAIKIVAYQVGRGIAPTVQTASPVEQIIHVIKP